MMIEKLVRNRYFTLALFLFALALYLLNTWGVSIYILDEAKNATCAREMLESRNLFVPTFNFGLRTDKPPLHYFFMMLAYKMFGVTPFAARFFSGVCGALTVLISFIYTKRVLGDRIAFWTATILLASVHLSIQFHLSVPDPYLIFFIIWSLFAFYNVFKTKSFREILFMYLAIAFGILAKGPVALLLPGLVFLLFLVFSRNFKWKTIKSFRPFLGAVIVIVVATPWFIINGLKTNWEWTVGFFGEHNLHRFSDTMEGHGGSFMITLLFVLAGLFPFFVFLPRALAFALKNRKNEFILFNLIAGITIVAFFSVSQTKLPNYTVPSYPFIMVLIAYFVSQKWLSFKRFRIEYFVLLMVAVLVPIAGFVAMKYDPSLAEIRQIVWWFLVLPFGIFLAYFFRKKLNNFLLLIAVSGAITGAVFFVIVFPKLDSQNPVSKSLRILEGKEIVFYKKYNPAYSFYLKKKIIPLTYDEFPEFFRNNSDGVIISTKKKIAEIKLEPEYEIVFSGKDLFETPTTVLIQQKNEK